MNVGLTSLAIAAALFIPAHSFAQTTIRDLQQQRMVTISGEVVRVRGDEFILRDRTGQMKVDAESRSLRQANLKPGDRITVMGEYDDDDFDAHSITTAQGRTFYMFDD